MRSQLGRADEHERAAQLNPVHVAVHQSIPALEAELTAVRVELAPKLERQRVGG